MRKSRVVHVPKMDAGDTAIDGLVDGILAGTLMLLALLAGGLSGGDPPLVVLGRFDLSGSMAPLTGLLAHYSISSVYGVVYGLLKTLEKKLGWRPLPAWLSGGLYGLALFLIARSGFTAGRAPALFDTPQALFLAAHLVYGLTLGFSMNARVKK